MKESERSNHSFYGMGIAPKILGVLDRMKFTVPTPIQHKTIPIALEGKDIIGVAQTGTGKTLAFAIPVIQRLSQTKGRCLVVVPTRELALQVDETFSKVAPLFGVKTVVIIGGASMGEQLRKLKTNCRVIIATPGRLADHMNQRTIHLSDVDIVVIDEADRMLDMGFLPDIKRILKVIPIKRQTMLFSATIPQEIVKIAAAYMKLPVHIEVAPSGTTAEHVIQELFIVKRIEKKQLLAKILEQYYGPVLIFSRTKRGAKNIRRAVHQMGHKASEIHSDRSLAQRKEALNGFKIGKYKVLVATDIAARGIDVIGIELVINYDLPDDIEQYVHRVGRTGRAGEKGRAISFATPEQGKDVRNIEKLIKLTLSVSDHPDFPRQKFVEESKNRSKPRSFGKKQGRTRTWGKRRR